MADKWRGEDLLTEEDKKAINEFKQNYGNAIQNLLQMLEATQKLLKKNTKKAFPK